MSAKIILTSEPSSAKFNDRVLLFDQEEDGESRTNTEEVRVSRSSTEENSDTNNAVFDCRVLSKPQAEISFHEGDFYLKDLGSRNGTFINNFCLGEEKEGIPIYSKDVLRFGSEVMIGKYSGKVKCIIARIGIYLKDGSEYAERPVNDKFFRAKEEAIGQGNSKRVSFVDEELSIEEKVDKLEKMITHTFENGQEMMYGTIAMLENKLERKENDNQTLMKTIAKIYEEDVNKKSEKHCLKFCLEGENDEGKESERVKNQIQDTRVTYMERELEETRDALKLKTDESSLLKEQLREQEEMSRVDEKDLDRGYISETVKYSKQEPAEESITHVQMKILFQDGWEKVESQNVEVKKVDNLDKVSEQNLREKKLSGLTSSVEKGLKINSEDYVNLKSLVKKENKFSEKFNTENARLLKIITEDQETIIKKDQAIYDLENSLQEKIDENKKLTEANKEHYYEEYNSILLEEISKMATKNNTNLNNLQSEIESLNKEKKDLTESWEKHNKIIAKYEALKDKLKKSEMIIKQKNKEIENKETLSKNKANIELTMNVLKKENSDLKVSNWQKDSDIAKLKESIQKKDNTISKSNSQIDQLNNEVHQLNGKNDDDKNEFSKSLIEKDKVINNMKGIIKEAEAEMKNSTSELSLKIESLDHLQSQENDNFHMKIIKEKDASPQFMILNKTGDEEESISDCTSILSEEIINCNEKETESELSEKEDVDVICEYVPPRPPRIKSKDKTANEKEKADSMIEEDQVEEESDTITFHDALNEEFSFALSDEEDVSIEDLELDEESDDGHHRKSDINIEGFGSQKNLRILANRFLNTKLLRKVLDVKKT